MLSTETIAIACALAMDAFAVATSASVSLGRVNRRQVFRFAFHFGLFQCLMPIIGYFAGASFADYSAAWDHWLAFAILAVIGAKAIYQVLKSANGTVTVPQDPTRGASLVMLSVATSIDALAVGLSFALLDRSIWQAALTIGVITGGLTWCGMLIGSRLGSRFGKRLEIAGGLVLIAIGIKIVVDHTLV
jgi:putative Mn2+ efflux pump MntP